MTHVATVSAFVSRAAKLRMARLVPPCTPSASAAPTRCRRGIGLATPHHRNQASA